nr:creatininase family protein [Mesorhizobium sp.]
MRYELMLPHQIRKAIAENWPVVLPLGVLEYHGEHMAVGMDTLAVVKILDLFEKEADIVILPPFYYGAASYAVAGPEGNGSVQVGGSVLAPFGEELFYSLLRIGFRNIHAIIHHQTENFAAGMPTDLAFKTAGRQAIFRFLEKERGEGWWSLCRTCRRRQFLQLGAGASAHAGGDERPISVRPCRHWRDVADAGAVPGSGGRQPLRRQYGMVHGDCCRRLGGTGANGRRDDPRSFEGDVDGLARFFLLPLWEKVAERSSVG